MPEVPKGATTPEDHKKPAAQLEAEAIETTDVQWRDHTFTVPTDPDNWPVAVLLAFEQGQNANGLKVLLGPKQWAKFMITEPLKRDVVDLFDVIGETLGLGN